MSSNPFTPQRGTESAIMQIFLNGTNVVTLPGAPTGSLLKYDFGGNMNFINKEMSASSYNMIYSTPNITTANNNTSFSFEWPTTGTNYTVSLLNPGFYQVSDLNAAMDAVMDTNYLYLTNASTGASFFFLQLVINTNSYGIQLIATPIPTSVTAGIWSGWTLPSGATWTLPATMPMTPLLNVPATNWGSLIGFSVGTYPSATQSTVYSHLSDFIPIVTPTNLFVVIADCVNNPGGQQSQKNFLLQFPPNGPWASLIGPGSNLTEKWVTCVDGPRPTINLQVLNQNLQPVTILDNSGTGIMLSIRDRRF